MPRTVPLIVALLAQAAQANLADAVWSAVQTALPYPAATAQDEPVDGSTTARWIVRRAHADEGALVAEVIANPLNADVQARAAEDMAAIQQEVFAAERRAQVEFERARESARQSGAPVAVQGITLDDEGLAGDRADADERMTIEVETGRAEHVTRIHAGDAPAIGEGTRGATWIVTVPARQLTRSGDPRPRYLPAEAIVFFAAARPSINEAAQRVFDVRVVADVVVAVILRGNAVLIDQVLARADWSRVIVPN
jgi:hypothetical protein